MRDERREGLGDEQGTKVGKPEPGQAGKIPFNADATGEKAARATQSPNAGRTAGPRDARSTGAGAEAVEGVNTAGGGHDREHRSGYGGAGGHPVESSDKRQDEGQDRAPSRDEE